MTVWLICIVLQNGTQCLGLAESDWFLKFPAKEACEYVLNSPEAQRFMKAMTKGAECVQVTIDEGEEL